MAAAVSKPSEMQRTSHKMKKRSNVKKMILISPSESLQSTCIDLDDHGMKQRLIGAENIGHSSLVDLNDLLGRDKNAVGMFFDDMFLRNANCQPNKTASKIAGEGIKGIVLLYDDKKDLELEDLTRILEIAGTPDRFSPERKTALAKRYVDFWSPIIKNMNSISAAEVKQPVT
jgi:hypothetical protein